MNAPQASGRPNPRFHTQAEAAVPETIQEAVAEPEVTLRELQEALEEEVLTRQSLSQELAAIHKANQNFARSGSGPWGSHHL